MAEKQDSRSNLLNGNVFKTMLSLSVPAILGMVVIGLYNFMDAVFVGRMVGPEAMDDLDHPVFREFNHWIAWNIPCVNLIPEALPGDAVSEEPFHIEQGIGYGKHVYRGPKPPFNGKHRYRFRVFALDTRLQLRNESRKKDLVSAMDGHILAAGELWGIYQRIH